MELSKLQAYMFSDKESDKHPSDWLRVVRVENVVERGYNCYGHRKEIENKDTSPIKEIRLLKDPIDIKKFNEVCKQSLGGLQTFKENGE
jgi:Xaa-Pro aminopeptidase